MSFLFLNQSMLRAVTLYKQRLQFICMYISVCVHVFVCMMHGVYGVYVCMLCNCMMHVHASMCVCIRCMSVWSVYAVCLFMMCVCLNVDASVFMCVQVHMCVWGQEVNLMHHFSGDTHPTFGHRVSYWNQGSSIRLSWLTRKPRRAYCLCFLDFLPGCCWSSRQACGDST